MKHHWVGQQLGGDPAEASSAEWVCYCDICGEERNDYNADDECREENGDGRSGAAIE